MDLWKILCNSLVFLACSLCSLYRSLSFPFFTAATSYSFLLPSWYRVLFSPFFTDATSYSFLLPSLYRILSFPFLRRYSSTRVYLVCNLYSCIGFCLSLSSQPPHSFILPSLYRFLSFPFFAAASFLYIAKFV